MLRPPMEPEDSPPSESAPLSSVSGSAEGGEPIQAARPEPPRKRSYGAAVGALVLGAVVFFLMSKTSQTPHGALWGGLALFGSVLLGLRALGLLQAAPPDLPSLATLLGMEPEAGEPRWLAP